MKEPEENIETRENAEVHEPAETKASLTYARFLPKASSLALSLAILCALILLSGFVGKRSYIPPETNLQVNFPKEIGDYRSTDDAPMDREIMDVLELSDYLNRSYSSPEGHSVHLYVGYVSSQDEGPLIHTPVGCLPGGGSEIQRHEVVPWWRANEKDVPQNIKLIDLRQGGRKQIVVYWYQERGRIIQNDWMERLYLFWDSVVFGRTDGALVRFVANVREDRSPEIERDKIRKFVELSIPYLQKHLPGKIEKMERDSDGQ